MKKIFIIIYSLIILITSIFFIINNTLTLRIKRVVDGDTVVLSNGERVRLIGLDTPETKDRRVKVQFFGKKASVFLKDIAEGKEVYLEFDQEKRDKYKRLLAYIYLEENDLCLNEEMIKRGYAFAYTRFPFKKMDEYRELQRKAFLDGEGLWAKEYEDSLATIERKQDLIRNAYRDAGRKYEKETAKYSKKNINDVDKKEDEIFYIGNKNSKVLHKSTCGSVKKMSEKNKTRFNSLEKALKEGYKKCRRCFRE